MNKVIVDCKISDNIKNALINKDLKLFYTKQNKALLEPINSHPDMLVRQLSKRELICDKSNLSYYKSIFNDYDVLPTTNYLEEKYPRDIVLNYVVFKNYFIHNLNFTDKYVLNAYKKRNYKFINVTQGYTKCSVIVGENSLITSDKIIYDKLKNLENILLIDHKQIILKGFDYGFIGGTSGLVNGEILFTGSLKKHSSYREIINFLELNNEKYYFLTDEDIVDFGSIIEIV
ncbi:hypothetical protein SAMN02745245_00194 [Anaerosphaera aminiphila DSM 21120]|uniref:DUF6873 domain-containing protein n=1 Tax=Anaerosphaera aminiphila DSM 21120 TaxID=1120995 RepID=A0A1M5P5W9_9FIRM|nr:hypothetical protein [Anaerosphaera aminiphila]SHG97221.1 hypothetical protein SAMN02745245_00194 [Anaerosphaera aminiphila DSM 21120]